MTSTRPAGCPCATVWTVPLLAVLLTGGCAQLNQLKSRIDKHPGAVAATTTVVHAPVAAGAAGGELSFASIVNGDLQVGHYAEGEQALRRYLQQQPGDRAAQAMLRQLTVDPEKQLGHASRSYVVQSGDSYSTLASRYLGDPGLFLVLARYNGSTNPSVLRRGETLRLPLSGAAVANASSAAKAPEADVVGPPSTDDGASDVGQALTVDPSVVPAAKTPRAKRLQAEIALLGAGAQEQELARLDEELIIEPQLKSAASEAAVLRKKVVADYHQRAIVLYRDQQLDQAIALWDRVLVINPGYEPAIVYRTRALELKQRLKQL
jgi:nucleoid-associated protein YgaU